MASQVQDLHFLLIPLMSQSHLIPLTDFAKLLAQHGLIVTIITTPQNAIRYRSIIDHARKASLKINLVPLEFPCQDVGLPDGCENMDALTSPDLVCKFFEACAMMKKPLEKLVAELKPKPSCIVATNALYWTQELSQKFNIPRYVFQTVSCFTLMCSNILSRTKVQETVGSDTEPFVLPEMPHKVEFTRTQLPETMTNRRYPDDLKDLMDQMKQAQDSAKGVLVNSFEELEPWYAGEYRRVVGKKFWCIGPVSLCNKDVTAMSDRGSKASIDEHFCLKWLDSKKPSSVIYACFGSLCHIPPEQLREIGLGLEASNRPFIWIIRGQNYSEEVDKWLTEERFEERVRGRGLVIRGWAPQVLILSHQSVGGFLTHCGWNSTLEGICAGVPMITWPMFAEQFYNEKLVVHVLRIGVRIGVEGLTSTTAGGLVKSDQVKKAIDSLMDGKEGEERRIRAGELREMANRTMEEGGSSYMNITLFIKDVIQQQQQQHIDLKIPSAQDETVRKGGIQIAVAQ